MKFKIRMNMVENIPGNFKNKFNISDSFCRFCNVTLTQEHVKTCQGRMDIREGLNLHDLNDLVIYFNRFLDDENSYKRGLKERKKKKEEEKQ